MCVVMMLQVFLKLGGRLEKTTPVMNLAILRDGKKREGEREKLWHMVAPKASAWQCHINTHIKLKTLSS
jgi:hypothetical protein